MCAQFFFTDEELMSKKRLEMASFDKSFICCIMHIFH